MKIQHLPYTPCRITSKYGKRNTGIKGASTYHQGVDIGTDKSKPYTATDGGDVTAILPGIVCSSYYNHVRGWVVLIDHGTIDGKNVISLYQHLKQAGTAKGAKVKAGDRIGTMGNTGVGAQLHLHFEIRLNGRPVDPEPYIHAYEEEEKMNEETIRQIAREEIQKAINGSDTKVSDWAKKELEEAVASGITDGKRPGGLVTREQAAIMAYRAGKK